MRLAQLAVVHIPKSRVSILDTLFKNWPGVFYLETCQRWIWVARIDQMKRQLQGQSQNIIERNSNAQIFLGKDAYLFLLRLATGLESEIIGETDIFGQMKKSWSHFCHQDCHLSMSDAGDLSPWIQRLFEDTKEIRTRYLQNLGGSSYGSLVRKLIRDLAISQEKPLALVGAGQIARSVAPFLMDSKIHLINRDLVRLNQFASELESTHRIHVSPIRSLQEEERVWKSAGCIVMCIPTPSERDDERIRWLKESPAQNQVVIHLGGMKEQCSSWSSIRSFYSLSDLFSIQNSLGNVRSVQINQAVRACEERAQLRALGGSLSISHGWEDLACFA